MKNVDENRTFSGKTYQSDEELRACIIIPCFNESGNILSLYKELKNLSIPGVQVHFIFVNDCSTDNTRAILEKQNIPFLDLSVNLGIGGCVQTGFKYAHNKGYDFAVQLDGDAQHPPGELHKILKPLLRGEADICIGSRFIDFQGFQSSFWRRLGINYFKYLNYMLVGLKIYDNTSGYRAINKKVLDALCSYYPDDYPEPESLIFFAKNNYRVKEVPVIMRERSKGKSSIHSFGNIYYMLKVTLGIFFIYFKLNK